MKVQFRSVLWIDVKYAKLAGSSIERFKTIKDTPYLANGRCPICGDSKTMKQKRRFYFYEKSSKVNAICHNCGYSASIGAFLKLQEPTLFKEYIVETFRLNGVAVPEVKKKPEIETELLKIEVPKKCLISKLPLLSSLSEDHEAKLYIKSRKLPDYEFRYAEKFCTFARQYSENFTSKAKDHPRIIIPFKDKEGKYYGFQARSINGEAPKYYTMYSSDESTRVFGIDRVTSDKDILVVEGPLDSLFLPNCIAALNSSLYQAASKISKILNTCPRDNFVLVFDNEPRNKEILEKYEIAIASGHRVVIWDDYAFKDINEGIEKGFTAKEIHEKIKRNTYSGLMARLKFNIWKKL